MWGRQHRLTTPPRRRVTARRHLLPTHQHRLPAIHQRRQLTALPRQASWVPPLQHTARLHRHTARRHRNTALRHRSIAPRAHNTKEVVGDGLKPRQHLPSIVLRVLDSPLQAQLAIYLLLRTRTLLPLQARRARPIHQRKSLKS